VPQTPQLWGTGTGLLVWLASVALIVGLPLFFGIAYLIFRVVQTGHMPDPATLTQDKAFILVSIGSTFPAHILTILICWLVVTGAGKRPFLQTLGWGWHPQFKLVHAVGLAFLMMGVAIASEKLLPHRETDLEQMLKLGYSIRVMVALLAVLTAPLVEEMVYRGVLYMGVERDWGKWAGVAAATFLFALVHVPQYRQSIAAITAILSLSLALTLVRAWTGKLLPCVVTHLVYNGVQAAALLFASGDTNNNQQTQAALVVILQSLGLN
jgi:membrane protease YdiL (CAAX protease family)